MTNNGGERDRSIEALLRRPREDAAHSPATEACVDAETLAAWIDGTLVGADHAAAERHSAGCARCQAMLASMARIAPPILRRPWWRSATIRWLAPAAAVATALALWVSVDRQQNPTVPPVAPPAVSGSAEIAAMSARSPDERARDLVDQKKDALAPGAKAVAPGDALARHERASEFAALRSLQPRSGNPASVATPAAATPAPSAPPPPAAPPLPESRVAGNAGPPPATEPFKPTPLAETVTVISDVSAKEIAVTVGRADGRPAFTTPDILSPEPAVRWRIGAPGTIMRSTNGGATWSSQRTALPVVLAAGSAPARDVCWVVGGSGAVVLSTDGTTWQLRPFPEAVNLTAVRAIDAKTAVVTTADGRQFSTTDGGATWSRVPL